MISYGVFIDSRPMICLGTALNNASLIFGPNSETN